MDDFIKIRGAREHNLKDINLQIPKNKLIVFSGVSGSGKSSLAMDTLYAEGQRRYVESLSSYARQFLGMLPRPDVDSIEGLSPSIAINQHSLSHNPRSTVGTVTEIYDYLRVLFARIGHPHCPKCGREVAHQTSEQITKQILDIVIQPFNHLASRQFRFMILSPVVRDKRGEFTKLFENLKQKGFEQVRIDGQVFELWEDLFLIKTNRHNIDAVVDRISPDKKQLTNPKLFQRIKDNIEIALQLSDGLATLSVVEDASFDFPRKPTKLKDSVFSTRFACPVCNLSLPEIEPRIFSFNSPFGACPECNGLGAKLRVDTSKIDPSAVGDIERRYYNTTSEEIREELEKYMIKETCQSCLGARLKKEALNVTINKNSIAQVASWDLEKIYQWATNLPRVLEPEREKEIAKPLLTEIGNRLSFLNSVGVGYLTLDRASATLSAGEGQRIRLASQVGSGLSGVLYILDEPTVGLHPRDTQKLIATLKKLKDLGNTLIVVEHDREVLEEADWIIDFGPGAGKDGGKVVAEGILTEIKKNPHSITGKYLSGKETVSHFSLPDSLPTSHLRPPTSQLTITGCTAHNLKNITVKLPLAKLSCITGVSGSGKSSLITDTLYPALKKTLNEDYLEKPGPFKEIKGTENINQVLLVDQSPLGRTSRSNPATYTGVFTDVRNLFAQTREAHLKGLTATHFSFNTEGGRCEACQGQGQNRVVMQFLPDIWIQCEECHGKRFKNEVLEVEYKDKNIAQVLDLTIKEAQEFFSAIPSIIRKLQVLEKIGLDYLELGQISPTLSGGESQRLKLARELVKRSESKTIYLLDEPTTGLHFADLKKLLYVLRALVQRGNTVVVIEHNLEIVKQADWVIDLGPEGGDLGGEIVTEGTPEQVAINEKSWTGKYLRKYINNRITE